MEVVQLRRLNMPERRFSLRGSDMGSFRYRPIGTRDRKQPPFPNRWLTFFNSLIALVVLVGYSARRRRTPGLDNLRENIRQPFNKNSFRSCQAANSGTAACQCPQ